MLLSSNLDKLLQEQKKRSATEKNLKVRYQMLEYDRLRLWNNMIILSITIVHSMYLVKHKDKYQWKLDKREREREAHTQYSLYYSKYVIQQPLTKRIQSWLYNNQTRATSLYDIYKNSLT